jgi:16S rRNA (uracil1498-N3)-methyltransferase
MNRRRAHIPPDELPDTALEDRHLELPDRIAHYVENVLRMSPGDALELFDGNGRLLECRVQSIRDGDVKVAVLADRRSRRNESSATLVLCPAIPKGDRWRWILEKTTELGVSRIAPLETERTVVDISEEKLEGKLKRWRRIVGDAARQCERTLTPAVAPPRSIERHVQDPFDGRDIVLGARGEARPLAEILRETADDTGSVPIRFWIGPEGGFADRELEQLHDSGAHFCHLGPRILRSETAATAAIALAQAAVGDLDGGRAEDP